MSTVKGTDPRSKIIFTVLLIVLAIAIPQIPILLLPIGMVLLIALKGSYLGKLISYLSPLGILVPILFAINLFFYASGEVYAALDLKIFELAVTSGGIHRSILICTRLIAVAFAAAWLVVTTPPEDFEYGLKKMGIPWKLAFILSLTMKLIPEMRRKFREIEEAQMSRGLESGGNPIQRVKRKIPILVPFLASVSRYGFDLSQVLKARNFGRERTYLRDLD